MTDTPMPDEIAAWRFVPEKADEWVNGGWSEDHDRKTTRYIRTELDAKLVGAAPDLLAACQEFCRKVDAGEARSKRSYAQMAAAIEKATT